MLEDLIYSILWGGVIILVIFVSAVIAVNRKEKRRRGKSGRIKQSSPALATVIAIATRLPANPVVAGRRNSDSDSLLD